MLNIYNKAIQSYIFINFQVNNAYKNDAFNNLIFISYRTPSLICYFLSESCFLKINVTFSDL